MFGLTFGGKCTNVVDGDTVDMEVKRTFRLRIRDCWAPETRTKDLAEKARGMMSRTAMRLLALGRPITAHVDIDPEARFGESMSMSRIVASAQVGPVDLAQAMSETGNATRRKGDLLPDPDPQLLLNMLDLLDAQAPASPDPLPEQVHYAVGEMAVLIGMVWLSLSPMQRSSALESMAVLCKAAGLTLPEAQQYFGDPDFAKVWETGDYRP